MPLSQEQISTLLGMIATAGPDELDCDGCSTNLAEFADTELRHREIPDAMRAIEKHLEQCVCCKVEYNALLEGLRAMEGK